MAHPARYRLTSTKLRKLIHYFVESGGQALELNGPASISEKDPLILNMCDELNLSISLGSDFHNDESPWQRLGETVPLPSGYRAVWELF